MSTTGKDLAIEVVRVSALETLSRAAQNETLSDVIGSNQSVLEARIGRWDSDTEERALRVLAVACEDALDEDATEESLIAYIQEDVRA